MMAGENSKQKPLPLYVPYVGSEEARAVERVLKSRWLTQGPEVATLEREFAEYVGAIDACAVSNCTTALRLALQAIGVQPGDEVITVSHSFIATANAIRHCGAIPVFVDVEESTFNIRPEAVERAIGPKTRAILCVHQMGMPAELDVLVEISRQRSIPLIEDAACAIGSEISWDGAWERIGRPRGEMACFSLHPRKLLTCGEGGMITVKKPEYAQKIRSLRHHGMSVTDWQRHSSKVAVIESYGELGYNDRMSDLQAAVAREQLKLLPQLIEKRRKQAQLYHELFTGINGLTPPREPEWARSNWQSYCVRLPDSIDQRALIQSALDEGISLKRGVMCAHREPAYSEGSYRAAGELTESEAAQDRCVLIPLFHEMTEADQRRVVDFFRKRCSE